MTDVWTVAQKKLLTHPSSRDKGNDHGLVFLFQQPERSAKEDVWDIFGNFGNHCSPLLPFCREL